MMAITLRHAGLNYKTDYATEDFTVYSGEWAIGRIHQVKGRSDWSWSLFGIICKPINLRCDGCAATLEMAKSELNASWQQWLKWAELSESRQSLASIHATGTSAQAFFEPGGGPPTGHPSALECRPDRAEP